MNTIKKAVIVLAVFLAGAEVSLSEQEGRERDGGINGNLNFFYGRKELEDDWGDASVQDEFGVELDIGEAAWPVHIVLGYRIAVGEGQAEEIFTDPDPEELPDVIETETQTTEWYAGIRKIFGQQLKLAFAGGVSLLRGEIGFEDDVTEDDSRLGAWGGVSVYVTLIDFINLGVSGRYSYAPVEIGAADLNAGGFHYNVFAGFNF